ncbi:MFS transporter [Legionella erythra]|uniref:Proline/glycine betaine transporter-like protein n=1 Tax=Legionella erythra TaxID=448 RepID=A0A0W0TG55_LEGER|nr:MFS transporter [Legionella erythra]KTC94607.1 proline/glycine betaine transporter-like protein [Legionella erythra]
MKRNALFIVLALIFLEWLDFSLYLYLAKSVFAKEFFPPSSYSLLLSFALFAAAFLARPLGGWLFGRQADASGRRKPMVLSAGLMGLATVGICLLPDYNTIGIAAAFGLLCLRVAQGLALGGEINTSAMFLIEHHARHPLKAGSLVAASGAAGMFLGGAMAALLQYSHIPWMWRIIFASVGLLSLWVCRLRKRLTESPEFKTNHAPIIEIWREHAQGLLNIAMLGAFVSVTVYICNAFWVSYAIDQALWSSTQCAWIGSLAQLSSALLALPLARLCKPVHVYLLLRLGTMTALFTAPMLFYCTTIAYKPGVIVALFGYVLTNGLICSSMFYFLYLQLPAQYRCRGVSTVWALAASIGAVSLPLAEQAVQWQWFWVPPLLECVFATIAFLFLYKSAPKPASLHVKTV